MTRALLEQALDALERVNGAMPFPVAEQTIRALRAEITKPKVQQERKHTEAEVQDIVSAARRLFDDDYETPFTDAVRRILGVPTP